MLTTETPGYDFRMVFRIRHADFDTPGTAEIRIYNLADSTAADVINEWDAVTLQAGYQTGHYGIIFKGTIRQYKRGRENATDSYLDIFAADGDAALNFAQMNTTIKNPTLTNVQKAIADAKQKAQQDLTIGEMAEGSGLGPNFTRPAILYGSAVDEARAYGKTTGTTWSVQNGVLQNTKTTAYARGEMPVINSGTGMIGIPEVTQDGILIKTLLNPNYYIKQRVQVDNRSLNNVLLPGGQELSGQDETFTFPRYVGPGQFFAATNRDGIYCILVIDQEGDTRGLPWYSHLTCINVDPTAKQNSVPAGSLDFSGNPPAFLIPGTDTDLNR